MTKCLSRKKSIPGGSVMKKRARKPTTKPRSSLVTKAEWREYWWTIVGIMRFLHDVEDMKKMLAMRYDYDDFSLIWAINILNKPTPELGLELDRLFLPKSYRKTEENVRDLAAISQDIRGYVTRMRYHIDVKKYADKR
jgi:hypothetical protein